MVAGEVEPQAVTETAAEASAATGIERKSLEQAWGFDDVAIVPGALTTNPDMVEPTFTLGEHSFALPIMASAMDAVVDPAFAIEFSKRGGGAVLNLDGVQTRYEDPEAVLDEIASARLEDSTTILQRDRRADLPRAIAIPWPMTLREQPIFLLHPGASTHATQPGIKRRVP